jgi:hypothetical protein
MDKSDDSKKNFFKYVFNFDDDTKSELMNIIQYSLIAIIPIIILNKLMQKYVPEADEQKGSLEILAEIVIQVMIIFIGLFIVNRIIYYIPTYSGLIYPEYTIFFNILSILLITLSLQTKLGEKVSILVERITDLWEGNTTNKQTKNSQNKGNGNVKVSQPISQPNPGYQPSLNQTHMYNDGTSINQLPTNTVDTVSQQNYTMSSQQLPNYNNMFQKDYTPLVGAASPGQTEGFQEPMAASDALGGFGGFSSW